MILWHELVGDVGSTPQKGQQVPFKISPFLRGRGDAKPHPHSTLHHVYIENHFAQSEILLGVWANGQTDGAHLGFVAHSLTEFFAKKNPLVSKE